MSKLTFQVEFLSDIVLPATSNTEGNINQLDFIPGSNFLGMVAANGNYEKFENSFAVFHSGKVRFGDANILVENQPTYKMPLCFFHEKTDDKKMRNQLVESLNDFTQPKQLRNGYITKDKQVTYINYSYAQKSAYDKDARRSKDSSMYGYKAITSGTKWQFCVQVDGISQAEETLLIKTLENATRLGKSKSAEYGQVKITQMSNLVKEPIEDITTKEEVILYANSRLALIDEVGNPTYELKYLCDDLKEENIVYEKTQIRTSSFAPYNGARQTKDYERVCINKGSVIVLQDISNEQLKLIQSGVGAYLSEGFGEILVNPSFLTEKLVELLDVKKDDINKQNQREPITQIFEDTTVQFLANRHNQKFHKLDIANEVASFIKQYALIYDKKMNSQWGTLRSLCDTNDDATIKEAVEDYISKGVAKVKWEGSKTTNLFAAIDA